jgi:hypothetical protein
MLLVAASKEDAEEEAIVEGGVTRRRTWRGWVVWVEMLAEGDSVSIEIEEAADSSR